MSYLIERLRLDAAEETETKVETSVKARASFSSAMSAISSTFSRLAHSLVARPTPEKPRAVLDQDKIQDHRWKKEVVSRLTEISTILADQKTLMTDLVMRTKGTMLRAERWRREDVQKSETQELANSTARVRDSKGKFVSQREENRKRQQEEGHGEGIMQMIATFFLGKMAMKGIGIKSILGAIFLGLPRILYWALKKGGSYAIRAVQILGLGSGPVGVLIATLLVGTLSGAFELVREAMSKDLSFPAIVVYVTKGLAKLASDIGGRLVRLIVDLGTELLIAMDAKNWTGKGRTEKFERIKAQFLESADKYATYLQLIQEDDAKIRKLRVERASAEARGDKAKIAKIDAEIAALREERGIAEMTASVYKTQTDTAKYEMEKEKSGWLLANLRWVGRGVSSFVKDIASWIGDWFVSLKAWGDRQLAWATSYVGLWYDSISGAFKSVLDTITGAFDTVKSAIFSIKDSVVAYVKSWLSWLTGETDRIDAKEPKNEATGTKGTRNDETIDRDIERMRLESKKVDFQGMLDKIEGRGGVTVVQKTGGSDTERLAAALREMNARKSQTPVVVQNTAVGPTTNVSHNNTYSGSAPSPYPRAHSEVGKSSSFANGM